MPFKGYDLTNNVQGVTRPIPAKDTKGTGVLGSVMYLQFIFSYI